VTSDPRTKRDADLEVELALERLQLFERFTAQLKGEQIT
jgi:hypothetical protein